jgi:hypothetical protein
VLTGESRSYPDLDGVVINQSREYEIDGVAYFERSDGGDPRTVELNPEGVRGETFTSTVLR